MSNVGGDLLSKTVLRVFLLRASISPNVTLSIPPIKSERVGFIIKLSRELPCAVAIN